jgi:hypothetical protein
MDIPCYVTDDITNGGIKMNTIMNMMINDGRKYSIAVNLLGGGLNLIAYAVTKRKSCLFYTVGSAAIVLFLTSERFKKIEEQAKTEYNK